MDLPFIPVSLPLIETLKKDQPTLTDTHNTEKHLDTEKNHSVAVSRIIKSFARLMLIDRM